MYINKENVNNNKTAVYSQIAKVAESENGNSDSDNDSANEANDDVNDATLQNKTNKNQDSSNPLNQLNFAIKEQAASDDNKTVKMSEILTEKCDENGEAKIILICEQDSHPFKTRIITLTPNVECKVGRLIAKSRASEYNAIFDCKVLSRNHAVLWYTDDNKFWVKDTKSSNGTFLNDVKLDTEPAELHFGDLVKFGVNVLENTCKEVHGCIIARVKLYLPDGREALPIENMNPARWEKDSQVSFDEMHRLKAILNEACQREKVLKSKLSNLQSILDTTKKNSTLCWQSMISEDELLHKIQLLEKKLQIMEKNTSENTLKNEILKLLDEKNEYQLTAKEALQKVYQERCDVLQKLSKAEQALATSEKECAIMRNENLSLEQDLETLSMLLKQLQNEYSDYRLTTTFEHGEELDVQEQKVHVLQTELKAREEDVSKMKAKIDMLETNINERSEELQALAMIDAAIPDLECSDEESSDTENIAVDVLDQATQNRYHKSTISEELNGCECAEDVRKITVSKWFENSNLKGNDQILNSILNTLDTEDENTQEDSIYDNAVPEEAVRTECTELSKALKLVRCNLNNLELEISKKRANGSATATADIENFETHTDLKCDSIYQQLENSLDTLRETFSKTYEQEKESAVPVLSIETNIVPKCITEQNNESDADEVEAEEAEEDEEEQQQINTGHVLEMLQVECENWKEKVKQLTQEMQGIRVEKCALENQISASAHKKGTMNGGTATTVDDAEELNKSLCVVVDNNTNEDPAVNYLDIEIIDNQLENVMDELVQYKERLEKSDNINLELREQIAQLQCRLSKERNNEIGRIFRKKLLIPLLVLALAAAFYFLINNRV